MKNITVSVDEETYAIAREWAAHRGTSITAIVKCVLVTLPRRIPIAPRAPRSSQPPASDAPSIQASADSSPVLIPSHGFDILTTTLLCARWCHAAHLRRKKVARLDEKSTEFEGCGGRHSKKRQCSHLPPPAP